MKKSYLVMYFPKMDGESRRVDVDWRDGDDEGVLKSLSLLMLKLYVRDMGFMVLNDGVGIYFWEVNREGIRRMI